MLFVDTCGRKLIEFSADPSGDCFSILIITGVTIVLDNRITITWRLPRLLKFYCSAFYKIDSKQDFDRCNTLDDNDEELKT